MFDPWSVAPDPVQLISKLESMAQSDPIPKGYGTVTFPHCFGHPGLAIFVPFVIVVGDTGLSAVGWAEVDVKIISTEQVNEKNRAICLCCMFSNLEEYDVYTTYSIILD
ncbi:hypothetical protein KY290_035591 [Solanum tuberosum]|uniref:Uncharacterized protein n=1 Tax=Solanum tuberosum TaxID=4113 RepID=A0ABQ7TQM5_SOLTU|nr:hypothetical protein KY290_035591 [Solanum tuberosum]